MQIDQEYLKELQRTNNLMTVSGASKTTSYSTYNLRNSRNRLFGDQPTSLDPAAKGILGTRTLVWAIKLPGENNYRKLYPEEEQLFNSLIVEKYSSLEPEQLKAQELIYESCLRQNLSLQEYNNFIKEKGYDFFDQVIVKFQILTGHMLVHATEHEIGLDFTLEENDA